MSKKKTSRKSTKTVRPMADVLYDIVYEAMLEQMPHGMAAQRTRRVVADFKEKIEG